VVRASSTSPIRPAKSQSNFGGDIFANQKFDPQMHRPKARYVPDGADATTATTSRRAAGGANTLERLKRSMAVTFKGNTGNNFSVV